MNLEHCLLCPRRCGADRISGVGACGGGDRLRIARAALHFGEEPCITGIRGSGTIFFSGCALNCCFCQNREISHNGFGKEISEARLSEIFLELKEQGAHNINLVTPSHYAPFVSHALRLVRGKLNIPVVVNCGGYESMEILREFDGLVDVYLPDLKYFSPERSSRYSRAEDYFEVASTALKEMFRQTGPIVINDEGLITRGLMIRHLVLPAGKSDSVKLLEWIARTFPERSVLISLMRQYAPCGDLTRFPEINRTLFTMEYDHVLATARNLGLIGFEQGRGCDNLTMTPKFDLTGVSEV